MTSPVELSPSRASLLNKILDACEKCPSFLDVLENGDLNRLIQNMRVTTTEARAAADDDTVTSSGYSDAQSDKGAKAPKKEKKPWTMKTQPSNFEQACVIAKAHAPAKIEGRKFDVKGDKGKFLEEMKQLHKELKATGQL